MNKNLFRVAALALAFVFAGQVMAQDEDTLSFTDVKRLETTSVKDQASSGTCWSFSTISFFETEILRMTGKKIDLSPMWIARTAYIEKAKRYVRFHGSMNFGGGGAFHDVAEMMKMYGIVPMSVYEGLNYGEKRHRHGEMDNILKAYVEAVVKNGNRKLSPAWLKGYVAILDAYLGEAPEEFTYEGKKYTPKSFFESTGLKMEDYVPLTSFTHQPYYKKFVMEVPDNWMHEGIYNVPLDELMRIMDYAIDHGYTFAWASDVSEKGFARKKGTAIVPASSQELMSDSEQSKWDKYTKEEKEQKANESLSADKITPEMRQAGYDNYETTDDHGMHIVGIAKDQHGEKYYIVKNSWGADWAYDGFFYASEAFVKYKTMDILIHKDAIPADIKAKLNIK